MLKKTIALIFALVLCFSMCGCAGKEKGNEEQGGTAPDPVPAGNDTFSFKTTDLEGNTVSFSDYSSCKLILVNMWEPWCGPCIAEMPDLELLYEKYAEEGFMILGVFGNDTDVNARQTVENLGITYPVLHANADFNSLESGYVPTSAFFDAEGNMLNSQLIIGYKSSEEWEELVKEYLG